MRIVCPGCDAEYEVPDEVIPAEGRDVQCSNCGKTWMFGPQDTAAETKGREGHDPVPAAADAEGEEAVDAPALRRELDPKVASILRAEAERETAARAADMRSTPLEIQPELGLTEAPRPPRQTEEAPQPAPEPVAAQRTAPGNMTVAQATAATGSRRDRLPDIEEINASLRSSERLDAAGGGGRTDTQRRRGFRLGLVLSLVIFGLCLLAYRFAPDIAAAVPQADPWISDYVTWVDETRTDLDAQLRRLLAWLDAQAAASDG